MQALSVSTEQDPRVLANTVASLKLELQTLRIQLSLAQKEAQSVESVAVAELRDRVAVLNDTLVSTVQRLNETQRELEDCRARRSSDAESAKKSPVPPPPLKPRKNHQKDQGDEDEDPNALAGGGGANGGALYNNAGSDDAREPTSEGITEDVRITLEERAVAEYTIPVLIFAYRRADDLRRCIDSVMKALPKAGFQLFVSQDSRQFPPVTTMLRQLAAKGTVVHLIHQRNDSGANEFEASNNWQPYFAISHHYGWAIGEVLSIRKYDRIILLEEDMEVSPDFFAYMKATSPLLDQDPSIYCCERVE